MDSGYWKLSFTNYSLNEPILKAIACTIPFLVNVEEIQMENNRMSDSLTSIIILSAFMNPTTSRLIINMNHIRGCATKSLQMCGKQMKDKIECL